MRAFFAAGGKLIDSSPMYGYSQDAIGEALRRLNHPDRLRSATKVWIPSASLGKGQIERAQELWGVDRFDLLQVHNLVAWEGHLEWLYRWRDEGRVRYVGVTTSHGRRHRELEGILRSQPIDFAQFTLNIADREAERRLLPLAGENGKAVIINRPFRGGELFSRVRGRALPDLAAELECDSWAQFFLLYVVSQPAVTCAIPATSRIDHLQENMAVLLKPLSTPQQRQEMVKAFESSI
jgi:diketogulonate reductase-like aldo/keto reductase